jgi:FKBP-type peptidyl-prolyl cis-trans isomerase 2
VSKIVKGMKVRVNVELTQMDGTAIEKSSVEYVHGGGTMLKGLEAALEGMSANETKEGTIKAKDAFGLEEDLPTMKLPRAQFPKDAKLEAGLQFEAKDLSGKPITFKVVKADPNEVTVRLLHPLAGKDIKFKVKVLAVVDPTKIPPPPAEAQAVELGADDLAEEN